MPTIHHQNAGSHPANDQLVDFRQIGEFLAALIRERLAFGHLTAEQLK